MIWLLLILLSCRTMVVDPGYVVNTWLSPDENIYEEYFAAYGEDVCFIFKDDGEVLIETEYGLIYYDWCLNEDNSFEVLDMSFGFNYMGNQTWEVHIEKDGVPFSKNAEAYACEHQTDEKPKSLEQLPPYLEC